MPRKMRVQYPGAMYHVMSRGDQRDDMFLDDVGAASALVKGTRSASTQNRMQPTFDYSVGTENVSIGETPSM